MKNIFFVIAKKKKSQKIPTQNNKTQKHKTIKINIKKTIIFQKEDNYWYQIFIFLLLFLLQILQF
jgi:hypothetical protein